MDCSPPGSSVYEIFQAKILEWIAISLSRASSWPRGRIYISCLTDWLFTLRHLGRLAAGSNSLRARHSLHKAQARGPVHRHRSSDSFAHVLFVLVTARNFPMSAWGCPALSDAVSEGQDRKSVSHVYTFRNHFPLSCSYLNNCLKKCCSQSNWPDAPCIRCPPVSMWKASGKKHRLQQIVSAVRTLAVCCLLNTAVF